MHTTIASAAPLKLHHTAIVWYRGDDLRLTDHEPLINAATASSTTTTHLIPIFCLDDRWLLPRAQSPLGLPLTGPYRLRALLTAVQSLQADLATLGSGLTTTAGSTEQLISRVAANAARISESVSFHYYQGIDPESVELEGVARAAFLDALNTVNLETTTRLNNADTSSGSSGVCTPTTTSVKSSIHGYFGTTTYHPDDIPFTASTTPSTTHLDTTTRTTSSCIDVQSHRFENFQNNMSEFRKQLQSTTPVRLPLPRPTSLPPLPPIEHQPAATASLRELDLSTLTDLRQLYTAAEAPTEQTVPTESSSSSTSSALQALEKLLGNRLDPKTAYEYPGATTTDNVVNTDNPTTTTNTSICSTDISEKAALARLAHILHGTTTTTSSSSSIQDSNNSGTRSSSDFMSRYKESRMMSTGAVDESARLSLFLSLGCISPRTIYSQAFNTLLVQPSSAPPTATTTTTNDTTSNDNTNNTESSSINSTNSTVCIPSLYWKEPTEDNRGARWLMMHLGIRDYFLFNALKVGIDAMQSEGGPAGYALPTTTTTWSRDESIFLSWARGTTGLPFVDANMRKLAATGWMSNRGRQNVANFLTKALYIDWRLGASLFETLLIDHSWPLNTGNWAYNSGLGFDPRDRKFYTVTQGERYDPQALSIGKWVPELKSLPPAHRHRPWEYNTDNDSGGGNGGNIVGGYPKVAVVDPVSQISVGKKKGK